MLSMLSPAVTIKLDNGQASLVLLGGVGQGGEDVLGGGGRLSLVVNERPHEGQAAVEVLLLGSGTQSVHKQKRCSGRG